MSSSEPEMTEEEIRLAMTLPLGAYVRGFSLDGIYFVGTRFVLPTDDPETVVMSPLYSITPEELEPFIRSLIDARDAAFLDQARNDIEE